MVTDGVRQQPWSLQLKFVLSNIFLLADHTAKGYDCPIVSYFTLISVRTRT